MRRARPRKRPSTLATKAPKKTVRAMVRKKSAESPSRPKAQYTPPRGGGGLEGVGHPARVGEEEVEVEEEGKPRPQNPEGPGQAQKEQGPEDHR